MRGLLHVAPALLVHVARMRIERGDHAVDRALHQLRIVGLLDIAQANALEHVAEQIELRIGIIGAGGGLGGRYQMRPLRSGHQDGQTHARYRAEEKGQIPAHLAILLVILAPILLNRASRPGGATTQWHFGRIKAVLPLGHYGFVRGPDRAEAGLSSGRWHDGGTFVIARSTCDEAIHSYFAAPWIASAFAR